ncbi:MAG: hypothetical protein FJ395_07850 [Verrucomicrobia bacterium]|nr:hypothetical protein [Verrucomicrobiota bacterium]
MKLTLDLESDLYATAKSLARKLNCSVSAAVHELLRRSLRPAPVVPPKTARRSNGLPIVHGRRAFGSEDVYRIEIEAA